MPDYMYLLESRLSPEQRAAVVRVQEIAQTQEVNVYLTGGAVRDLITGMPIRDLDFTVEGNPARIARELEKGGAKLLEESERTRQVELLFNGDVDGSLAAARDEVYPRPGARPETRWSTVMEDLRRRDFSCNAVALSLNPASRGLLLDPTNGLADLEGREVRLLSMHGFTNQPDRLLRLHRYKVRLDFKVEPRTADWRGLALERGLAGQIDPEAAGAELRQLAREDRPVQILKAWVADGLLAAFHPKLARRSPDYDGLAKLMKAREAMIAAGYRQVMGNPVMPRLLPAVVFYAFARLNSREQSLALARLGFRAAERECILGLEAEARKVLAVLAGRKTDKPREAYKYLETVPLSLLCFLQAEYKRPKALGKIRNFLYKWKPLRAGLPVAELESLGVPRGPKFDKIIEEFFDQQLRGKGKTPEDRTKLLRKLAGIKPEPKVKPKKELKKKEPPKKAVKKGKEAAAEAAAAPAPVPEAAKKPAAPAPPAKPSAPVKKPAAKPAAKKPAPAKKPKAAKKAKPAKKRPQKKLARRRR